MNGNIMANIIKSFFISDSFQDCKDSQKNAHLKITRSLITKLTTPETQSAVRLHIITSHPNKNLKNRSNPIFSKKVIVHDRLYNRYLLMKVLALPISILSFQIKKNEHMKLKRTAHSNEMNGERRYSPANEWKI
jgi:hypothetical protein